MGQSASISAEVRLYSTVAVALNNMAVRLYFSSLFMGQAVRESKTIKI